MQGAETSDRRATPRSHARKTSYSFEIENLQQLMLGSSSFQPGQQLTHGTRPGCYAEDKILRPHGALCHFLSARETRQSPKRTLLLYNFKKNRH